MTSNKKGLIYTIVLVGLVFVMLLFMAYLLYYPVRKQKFTPCSFAIIPDTNETLSIRFELYPYGLFSDRVKNHQCEVQISYNGSFYLIPYGLQDYLTTEWILSENVLEEFSLYNDTLKAYHIEYSGFGNVSKWDSAVFDNMIYHPERDEFHIDLSIHCLNFNNTINNVDTIIRFDDELLNSKGIKNINTNGQQTSMLGSIYLHEFPTTIGILNEDYNITELFQSVSLAYSTKRSEMTKNTALVIFGLAIESPLITVPTFKKRYLSN